MQKHQVPKLCHANFCVLKVAGVKQDEADKARHITHGQERRPSFKEAMLGLSREIAVLADVMAHKLNTSWEEKTFKTKGETLGTVDLKLALKVLHSNVKSRCPAENVIDNDSSVAGLVKDDDARASNLLPSRIHVIDENDEDYRSVDGAEGHH